MILAGSQDAMNQMLDSAPNRTVGGTLAGNVAKSAQLIGGISWRLCL